MEGNKRIKSAISSCLEILGTNEAHIAITIVGAILNFLPIMAGVPSKLESTIFGATLRNESPNGLSTGISLVVIALVVPLAFDLIIDLYLQSASSPFSGGKRGASPQDGQKDDIDVSFNNIEKVLFLFGAILPSCFRLAAGASDRLALLNSCANKSQLAIVYGAACASLCRYSDKFFPGTLAFANIIMMSLGNILAGFVSNDPNFVKTSPLNLFRYICCFGAGFSLVVQCILWLLSRLRGRRSVVGVANNATSYSRDDDAKLFFQTMHVFSYIFVFAFLIYLTIARGGTASYDDMALFLWTIPYVFYVLSMSLFSMRLVKYKVIQGYVSIYTAYINTYYRSYVIWSKSYVSF
jgi:hypothetical protein